MHNLGEDGVCPDDIKPRMSTLAILEMYARNKVFRLVIYTPLQTLPLINLAIPVKAQFPFSIHAQTRPRLPSFRALPR